MPVMTEPVIRWMIRRDLPEVLKIEDESFKYPWRQEDFENVLKERNVIGMVAEIDEKIVGYMIYELHKRELLLINFAVDYNKRREGIGSAMVDKLKKKLNSQRRRKLSVMVADFNLHAQLFFKSQGLFATEIIKDAYDDNDADGYLMEYLC